MPFTLTKLHCWRNIFFQQISFMNRHSLIAFWTKFSTITQDSYTYEHAIVFVGIKFNQPNTHHLIEKNKIISMYLCRIYFLALALQPIPPKLSTTLAFENLSSFNLVLSTIWVIHHEFDSILPHNSLSKMVLTQPGLSHPRLSQALGVFIGYGHMCYS